MVSGIKLWFFSSGGRGSVGVVRGLHAIHWRVKFEQSEREKEIKRAREINAESKREKFTR